VARGVELGTGPRPSRCPRPGRGGTASVPASGRGAVGHSHLRGTTGKPVCWRWWRSVPVFSNPSVVLGADGALLLVEGVTL